MLETTKQRIDILYEELEKDLTSQEQYKSIRKSLEEEKLYLKDENNELQSYLGKLRREDTINSLSKFNIIDILSNSIIENDFSLMNSFYDQQIIFQILNDVDLSKLDKVNLLITIIQHSKFKDKQQQIVDKYTKFKPLKVNFRFSLSWIVFLLNFYHCLLIKEKTKEKVLKLYAPSTNPEMYFYLMGLNPIRINKLKLDAFIPEQLLTNEYGNNLIETIREGKLRNPNIILTDPIIKQIKILFKDWFNINTQDVDLRLEASGKYEYYDPLIDSLTPYESSGSTQFDMMVEMFPNRNNKYVRNLFLEFMLGTFDNIYTKDFSKYILVLAGDQTTGKSPFISAFLKPFFDLDIVKEDFKFDDKDKDRYICTYAIGLLEELSGLKKVESNLLKSTTGQQSGTFRIPYDRKSTTQKRIMIFMGSTNENTISSDLTGLDRFRVLQLDRCFKFKKPFDDRFKAEEGELCVSDINYFEVWGYVYHMWKTKQLKREDLSIDIELTKSISDSYREMSMEEEIFRIYLQPDSTNLLTRVRIIEILNEYTKKSINCSHGYFGKIMKLMGITYIVKDGLTHYYCSFRKQNTTMPQLERERINKLSQSNELFN